MLLVAVVVAQIKEESHNRVEMAVTVEVLLVVLDHKEVLVEPINQIQI